jgi:hypothetical protein
MNCKNQDAAQSTFLKILFISLFSDKLPNHLKANVEYVNDPVHLKR